MRVYRQRRKRSPLLKIVLVLVLTVGISFSLAWVWHTAEQSSLDAVPDTSVPPVPEPEVRAEPEPEEPLPEPVSEPEPEPEEQPQEPPATSDGAVPLSDPVDNSYFDDAIFFGDSISTGIPLYHIADNAAVVAMTGITTDTVNTKKCIDIGGEERVTFLEAATQYGDRGKVYIMLGGNGLDLDTESFIHGYKTFIDSVKQQYPNAIVYLQSITPVVEGYKNEIIDIDNELIDKHNEEILALAKRENVYYLDVASALKNADGALPDEASPTDGMHFTPEYYLKWFEYLKQHTVKSEGRT